MTKQTIQSVRPAKTQISLGMCPVWSEPSLCAQLIAKDPSFLHADGEDSDQTRRMPRLIWVFAGRTCHFIGFVTRRFISLDDMFVRLVEVSLRKSIEKSCSPDSPHEISWALMSPYYIFYIFTLSVRPSVCPSVTLCFFFLISWKCSDGYSSISADTLILIRYTYIRNSKGKGPILLKLLPFVKFLNAIKSLCAYYLFNQWLEFDIIRTGERSD